MQQYFCIVNMEVGGAKKRCMKKKFGNFYEIGRACGILGQAFISRAPVALLRLLRHKSHISNGFHFFHVFFIIPLFSQRAFGSKRGSRSSARFLLLVSSGLEDGITRQGDRLKLTVRPIIMKH